MNYDEMLSSGNVQIAKGALLPIGFLHKKQREGKFDNVLDLRRHLSDSVLFAKNVRHECEENGKLNSPRRCIYDFAERGRREAVEQYSASLTEEAAEKVPCVHSCETQQFYTTRYSLIS